ncbi:hypothetical protein MMC30_000149 [Trapelia coarctata]|nr:hypothetical protein [Trapelia coarctata]
MNDDPSSSTSDIPTHDFFDPPVPEDAAVEEEPSPEDGRRLKIRMQQAKRATFLDDLIRNLDIAIYCELSILYYTDCSFLRFFSRALPQWFYFTPKPAFFPSPPPNRPYIAAILLPNFFNLLFHIISSPPTAGEAMRGYIHGALLIDFVGELGPISKIRLVLLDFLTMVLQFMILAIVLEREGLKKDMVGSLAGSAAATTLEETRLAGQDHDAEEQGVHRSALDGIQDFEVIEMQPLRSSGTGFGNDQEEQEPNAVYDVSTSLPRASRSEHPLDTFNSGQHVIADLHVIETIRTSYRQWLQGGTGTGASVGQGARASRHSVARARRRSGTANGNRTRSGTAT